MSAVATTVPIAQVHSTDAKNTDIKSPTAATPTTTKQEHIVVIGFGNLANATNDEKSDQYRFGTREGAVQKAIAGLKTHVFAASELRVCADADKKTQLQPAQIASRLSAGTGLTLADCRPQNLDAMSFWRTTLFDATKLEVLQSGCEWAINPVFGSTKVEERGVMLMFTQFRTLAGKHTFWVINSHMPLASAEQIKTIEWLNANAENVCKNRWKDANPIIFYGGDQNTFFDRDGKEMMQRFAVGWVHLTPAVKETFRSFPHDVVQTVSLLDHGFVNKAAKDKIKLHQAVAHDTQASDHFFLTIAVSFL